MHYYNEIEPKMAAWLRALMEEGFIPSGHVDERNIVEVKASDLEGYIQCHFFAGIGGWSYALRLAGYPEGEEVWTGSCPCQPLSCSGQGKGHADERHLWPAFYELIAQRKPATVFGEQVASKDGREWFAGVRADLEGVGYAVGGADLCAAGVSAPHIRQRLYWVANNDKGGCARSKLSKRPTQPREAETVIAGNGLRSERLSDASSPERGAETEGRGDVTNRHDPIREEAASRFGLSGEGIAGVVNANNYHEHWWSGPLQVGWNCIEKEIERGGRKYRAQWRIKPGLSLLADGIPGRVAQLCGFGNAIVPQVAAQFIEAYLETKQTL